MAEPFVAIAFGVALLAFAFAVWWAACCVFVVTERWLDTRLEALEWRRIDARELRARERADRG